MTHKFPKKYLGDGVYASFDGWHVWLHVGDHKNNPCVGLDPEVLANLFKYDKDVRVPISELKEEPESE